MKRYIALALVSICLILSLAGCASKYNAEDFIGKTAEQIINEYGPFDCVDMAVGEDGLYRNGECGYTIKEPQRGFLGTSEEILFFIMFDENGIATDCREGYRPGG